jgi:hypothetical protein
MIDVSNIFEPYLTLPLLSQGVFILGGKNVMKITGYHF